MKKLFFSAILAIAFSVTSFASTKGELNKTEPKVEPKTEKVTEISSQDSSDGCVTITYRWSEGESDGEGGMILTFHKFEVEFCI
jgi:hypothetical protein